MIARARAFARTRPGVGRLLAPSGGKGLVPAPALAMASLKAFATPPQANSVAPNGSPVAMPASPTMLPDEWNGRAAEDEDGDGCC